MATVQELQSEALCSVCLEYFKEPVSIACGHNFCRACIELCWDKAEGNVQGNFSCPQCRETIQERNFRPNRALGNMVELVKRLKLEAATEASPVAKGVCTTHQEPLKLFCREDETPICVICRESRDHRSHKVLPIEEAAEDYKEQIQSELQKLKHVRENVMQMQLQEPITMKKHLEKIEMERVKEFDQLHQFEQEQKSLFLDQLKELQKEVEDEQKSKAENADRLSTLIRDMEKICQQSDIEFLQDIKSTLSRSRVFQWPVSSSSLTQKFASFSRKNAALKVTLKNFKEAFTSELKKHERQLSRTLKINYDEIAGPFGISFPVPQEFIDRLAEVCGLCTSWKGGTKIRSEKEYSEDDENLESSQLEDAPSKHLINQQKTHGIFKNKYDM